MYSSSIKSTLQNIMMQQCPSVFPRHALRPFREEEEEESVVIGILEMEGPTDADGDSNVSGKGMKCDQSRGGQNGIQIYAFSFVILTL